MRGILCFLVLLPFYLMSQELQPSEKFWQQLQQHCGKSYEGWITNGAVPKDGFTGERLVMHVRSCDENSIRIPFFVGENKSRTWILTLHEDKTIQLQHDHRHEDGSEEDVNFYGGHSSNVGLENLQMFPADAHTTQVIPAAATNVWWFTIDEESLTYNLRRLGTERYFSVYFDLTEVLDETPPTPWGTE